jgi:hypothetical protein
MSTQYDVPSRIESYLDHLFDEDPLYISEFRDILSFVRFLPELLSNLGMRCDGFVFRHRYSDVTLTVKCQEDGVPLVAFTTAADTTSCMVVFLRALRANKVRWIRDKFPWN